jgi:twitching motility protein PilT
MNKDQFDHLLAAMIQSESGVSDLLFVPGRPPQMACYGQLRPFSGTEPGPVVTPEFTEQIAAILINGSKLLADNLQTNGSCDCSYALREDARFRVNVYRQCGQLATVMRKLSNTIPDLQQLGLPPVLAEVIKERTGLVFVTGATGMGKTSTLAAILHELNKTQDIHIVTLEDPIEFLHKPIRATFSQREFGKDFFTFPNGLKAALRQAPKAILVGEVRDRETMEVALTAAETGHVVFATLHTINAGQTINRVLGMFAKEEEQLIRQRLADTLRWVVSQRLIPRISGGLHLVTEIMGNNLRSREVIQLGENEKRNLHEIIEASVTPWGWHSFEQSLLKAYLAGHITEETALLQSTHKNSIRQAIDLSRHSRPTPKMATTTA